MLSEASGVRWGVGNFVPWGIDKTLILVAFLRSRGNIPKDSLTSPRFKQFSCPHIVINQGVPAAHSVACTTRLRAVLRSISLPLSTRPPGPAYLRSPCLLGPLQALTVPHPSLSLLILGLWCVWHFLVIRLNLSVFWQEHHRNDVSFSAHDIGSYIMLMCLIMGMLIVG